MGNGKAKLSPRGKSRGRHRGKGVARQRWGLGPQLWGHAGCLLHRGTDIGQAPHHHHPWALTGSPGTHTHTHTHTHARTHTLPYQPDNLVLKSGSSSESQPSPQPVLGLDNRMARETLGSSRGLLGPGGGQGPEHSPPARDRMANGQGPGPEPAGVPWPQPSLQSPASLAAPLIGAAV